MPRITIQNLETEIEARPAQSVLNSLLYEEQPIHTKCGGRGRCGCCRVRVIKGRNGATPINVLEKTRLTEAETQDGWRLGCQLHHLKDLTIYLPKKEDLDSACGKK